MQANQLILFPDLVRERGEPATHTENTRVPFMRDAFGWRADMVDAIGISALRPRFV